MKSLHYIITKNVLKYCRFFIALLQHKPVVTSENNKPILIYKESPNPGRKSCISLSANVGFLHTNHFFSLHLNSDKQLAILSLYY
jgi:hypothetical protein